MTTKKINLNKLLSDACIPLFAEIGFKKKKEGIFYKKYGDDLYLRIGFNTSSYKGDELIINPMFGVGWRALEALKAECNQEKYSPYLFQSFIGNLGVMGEADGYTRFTFYRNTMLEDVKPFQEYLHKVALLTEKRFATHADLEEGILKFPSQEHLERLACYYFLMENKPKAMEYFEKAHIRTRDRGSLMWENFQIFAKGFMSKIDPTNDSW